MSEALRSSGKHVRLAMAGVAAMLLGGCADSSRLGDPFADPFKSSATQFDRTPTGTVNQPQVAANQAPGFDPGSFFSDAFKPFDAPPAPPAPSAQPTAVRAPAPRYSAPKPIAVQSQPLSAPSFAAPANPVYSPAPPVSSASIVRSAPSAVGGWTSEGGVPVVVGQGESAESIATRYGVPTTTLLAINGYANRSQVTPGSRLTIPVYHASGAVRAAAAPAPLAAPMAPRAQLAKLEAPKAPTLAMKPDPAAAQAEKRAKAAQAQADAAGRKVAVAQAAQEKTAQSKAAKAQVAQAQAAQAKADQAKAAKAQVAQATQAAQAKTLKAEADKARAVKEASAKQLAANKVVVAKTVSAKPAAEVQTLAAVKPAASAKTQQIASAAPILQAAPVQAAVKPPAPAAPQAAPADTTASLPSPGAGAGDSANPEFRWPARGRVIQSFGAGGNDGINIAVPEGTQVKAAEGGVVAYAGSELKGYGNLVLIRHPNGFVSAYANNGSINVKRGETVKRGQTIALSGQTGNVASPQLHFELRKGQKPVDPSNYLAGL